MTRPRRGRPPKSEGRDVRREILDVALTLFARHGYEATSIRQIAQGVGVTNPALYAHFDSKRAIYCELMRQGGPPVAAAAIVEHDFRRSDPEDFLQQIVTSVWRTWDTDRHRRFLSLALREGLRSDTGEAAELVQAVQQVTEVLGSYFEAWAAAGVLRTGPVEGRHLAFELFGMVALIRILYLNEASTPPQREQGRKLVQQHLDFFLDTVLEGRAHLSDTARRDAKSKRRAIREEQL